MTMETVDVVAAVIVRDGRLLLVQRGPGQGDGWRSAWRWHCPEGEREGPDFPGATQETREDAAIRVAREELGLDGPVDLSQPERGPVAEHRLRAGGVTWYAIDIGRQDPLPLGDAVGLGWFTPAELFGLGSSILTLPTWSVIGTLVQHMRTRRGYK